MVTILLFSLLKKLICQTKAITVFSVVHTNKLPVLPLNTFPPILNSVDLTQKKGVNIGGGTY